MNQKTEMLLASVFSLAVGLAAGIYAMRDDAPAAPVVSAAATQPDKPAAPSPLNSCEGQATGPYEYTSDWVNTENRIEAWNHHFKPLADKPVNYLEIGVYEGRSMVWMLENVLTHPDSRAVGIDVMTYSRYLRNLARTGDCAKVKNIKGYSQDLLHTLPKSSFDLIYIDGSHLGRDVLVDAALSFDLLKVGGMIVFDDYQWYTDWSSDMRPGVAIDSFVTMYRHELELVHKGYQVIVRKRAHPCAFDRFRYTPVGQYCYGWVKGDLVRQSDRKPVTISTAERELIAKLLGAFEFGKIDPPADRFSSLPEFQAMSARLKLIP